MKAKAGERNIFVACTTDADGNPITTPIARLKVDGLEQVSNRFFDKSAKDKSASHTSAKPGVQMSAVQLCEWTACLNLTQERARERERERERGGGGSTTNALARVYFSHASANAPPPPLSLSLSLSQLLLMTFHTPGTSYGIV